MYVWRLTYRVYLHLWGECTGLFCDEHTQLVGILGVNVLDCLAMILENVDADDGLVEVWIRRLNQFVVDVLRVIQCVEA